MNEKSFLQRYGLILGFVVMACVMLAPTPVGLSAAGKIMIAILLFSVTVWMTDSVSYPVSAGIIISLMAIFIGFSPAANGKIFGTGKALSMALGGFSNTAFALVTSALFLATAMTKTGLDKRIALVVLSKIGAKTNRVVAGIFFVGFALSFFVPSTTARVSCMVPIILGMINAFGVELKSKFAGVLMIAAAQADSIWNVGIKTAAAQNMIAINFIRTQLGVEISWMNWFIAAAPFAFVMSVFAYWILMKVMPPEIDEIEGGEATVRKLLTDLGPMTFDEKKLLFISIILLGFWSTEQVLHTVDTSTSTMVAIAIMFLPKVGVIDWNYAQSRINWGTAILFGVGISLGSALLSTKAADWLAKQIIVIFSLTDATPIFIIAILSAFLIIIHLGFASASGLAAAMIPIIISILQSVKTPGINVIGMTIILQYVVSFGFILPVNAPQNMIAYGTNTFEVKDFIKTGIPMTIVAYALVLIFSATYWKWIGNI